MSLMQAVKVMAIAAGAFFIGVRISFIRDNLMKPTA